VTVSDPAGGTVSAASVALTSLGLAFDRFGDVDASGSFTFDRVALGAFHVQAVEQSGISRRGSAAGELAGAGGSVTVPIALPQTTTLQGEVLGATYGASVEAVGLDHDGPLGLTEAWAWASPTFSLTVPIGSVRVGAVDGAGDPPLAGLAEGEAGPGSSTVDVGLGNAVSLSADLAGSDGFQYVVDCNGTLTGGGTSDASAAYWSANYLSVADRGFPGWPCLPALADEEGRELAIGARDVAGIRVARKVYVPPYGGFARYLEVLTNTGTAPVTVPVTVAGNLRSDAATRILASPASTGRTYALTDADECCRPVLGHVFAGPDGRVVVQATHFDPGDGYYSYRWTVTIGPGATVAFMHFAVQRDRQDADGARQQAEALVSLADPHALEGMTSEERSQVVNFDVR
jgi:hypothetical protein